MDNPQHKVEIMLQTVTHTSHQDKLHLYPFPRQQNNVSWQSLIPHGPDKLLAAPQEAQWRIQTQDILEVC